MPSYFGDSIGWWDGDTLIVDTVGFNDQSHFTRIFRRYLGVSPSAYRNSLENAHDSLLPQAVNY